MQSSSQWILYLRAWAVKQRMALAVISSRATYDSVVLVGRQLSELRTLSAPTSSHLVPTLEVVSPASQPWYCSCQWAAGVSGSARRRPMHVVTLCEEQGSGW
jgi:hypothetical protein